MMKFLTLFLFVMFTLVMGACSSDDNSGGKNNGGDNNKATLNGDHVWKEQTDALKQAEEVSALTNDAAEQQRKAMEEIDQP
jgi:hypothetical protein